ncbi:hypothetical protein C2M16_11325 [Escherichia coli]|uniref:Uncharacterized protein n=1 Tax=Escherichia coli TaxID=562 RepID=A0A2K3TU26_ECOLX|nr:hypothetical protein C2M16_11325 [Escherichia coli]
MRIIFSLRYNLEPHQHSRRLLSKPTFAHILSIADRNHSHYHCTVDYLISPSLANHLVSCRCQTPHEVVIQLMRNK